MHPDALRKGVLFPVLYVLGVGRVAETRNALNEEMDEPGQYECITTEFLPTPPQKDFLIKLSNLPHGQGHSDFVDALVVSWPPWPPGSAVGPRMCLCWEFRWSMMSEEPLRISWNQQRSVCVFSLSAR